jgi:hypothetical protein
LFARVMEEEQMKGGTEIEIVTTLKGMDKA